MLPEASGIYLIQIVDEVYKRLKLNVLVKLNNRKVLAGIAEIIGEAKRIIDITVAIDKLDKIGLENVNKEMLEKGIPQEAIDTLQPIILLSGTNTEKLTKLKEILSDSEIGMKGIEELETVFSYLNDLDVTTEVELDLTLARGLNYYTGAIFEVKSKDMEFGSITGGGRYDDLTGIFGLKDVSGVGISFGADRIYDVLEQMDKFPADTVNTTKVMFVNFGEKEEKYCLPILARLRANGVKSEIFPGSAKMKKQMNYANDKHIPFVIMVGETEMEEGLLSLKDMETGEQIKLSIDALIEKLA
jgi:histidyl-tRNA synthetase